MDKKFEKENIFGSAMKMLILQNILLGNHI